MRHFDAGGYTTEPPGRNAKSALRGLYCVWAYTALFPLPLDLREASSGGAGQLRLTRSVPRFQSPERTKRPVSGGFAWRISGSGGVIR